MNCCVCGASVNSDQLEKHKVEVEGSQAVTCCPEHQSEAREHPDHCSLSPQTTLDQQEQSKAAGCC